jgi:hypothetical protein
MEINKGDVYQIKPSMGFLGIDRGKVKVIRIARYENVCEEYVDPEVLVESDPELINADWIVYCYTEKNPKEILKDCFCLDKETFVYHIGNPKV